MAAAQDAPFTEEDLQGFKYLKLLQPMLLRRHDAATKRDFAGNRCLFFDHEVALLLRYFFNPVVTSLRSVQKASSLKKVQRLLGCGRAALGSLSEASRVFDADLLEPLLAELVQRLPPGRRDPEARLLQGLTAVDGTLLDALPKMAWALWLDDEHRAVKVHLQFEVLRNVPVQFTLSDANTSEKAVLQAHLQAGRLHVADAGYVKYALFQAILDAGSSFVIRLGRMPTEEVLEERSVTDAARAAGVVADRLVRLVRLGSPSRGGALTRTVRLVEVVSQGRDGPQTLRLVTDRLDLPAEVVASAYRYRWQIELFFRWFKCVLGGKHLLSTSANGMRIQIYVALIVGLLISLWTGRKPSKRTLEMIQFYLGGWASEQELWAHIQSLPPQPSVVTRGDSLDRTRGTASPCALVARPRNDTPASHPREPEPAAPTLVTSDETA